MCGNMANICVIVFYLFCFMIPEASTAWCHSCTNDCGPNRFCYTSGKCYVRYQANTGAAMYGCMPTWYGYNIDFRANGCSYYRSPISSDSGAVWCFCDTDYCNSDLSLIRLFTNPTPTTTRPPEVTNVRAGVDRGGNSETSRSRDTKPISRHHATLLDVINSDVMSRQLPDSDTDKTADDVDSVSRSRDRSTPVMPTGKEASFEIQQDISQNKGFSKEPLEVHIRLIGDNSDRNTEYRTVGNSGDNTNKNKHYTLAINSSAITSNVATGTPSTATSTLFTGSLVTRVTTDGKNSTQPHARLFPTTVPLVVMTRHTQAQITTPTDGAGVTPETVTILKQPHRKTNTASDTHARTQDNGRSYDYEMLDVLDCGRIYVPSTSAKAQRFLNIPCPTGFEYHERMQCCYKLVRQSRDHTDAERHCRGLHQAATLTSLETMTEYRCLVRRVHDQPSLHAGWQGWWTSGRYNKTLREFIWSSPNHMISRLDRRWLAPLLRTPFERTCVWLVPQARMLFGNYFCGQRSGFICEITL